MYVQDVVAGIVIGLLALLVLVAVYYIGHSAGESSAYWRGYEARVEQERTSNAHPDRPRIQPMGHM